MARSQGTRPGIAVVGRARSSSDALSDLAQRVAWMVARGWRSDTIERLIASWMREGGAGPSDVGRVVHETTPALPWREARLMAGRVDRFARRPDAGPQVSEAEPVVRPWVTRDPGWFASLRVRANDATAGLSRLGIRAEPRGPSHRGVRLRESLIDSPRAVGALESGARAAIPFGLAPGVYAIQAKAELGAGPTIGTGPSPAHVLSRLGAGRALAPELTAELGEHLTALGRTVDLEHVRVHEGAVADALCRQMHAEAFAVGRHVVFRAGRFDPKDTSGLGLLAHELTHVWQQAHGLTEGGERDAGLEADADRVGRAVVELRARAEQATPRAGNVDGLVAETKALVRKQRTRPAAVFIVTDRITAYDPDFRALGTWRLTGPCPLARGFWLDGGAGAAAWSTLSTVDRARLTRGRHDDLWVVGARSETFTPALAHDDLAAALRVALGGDPDPARALGLGALPDLAQLGRGRASDLGLEVERLLATLVGPTADGGLASATTPDVSLTRDPAHARRTPAPATRPSQPAPHTRVTPPAPVHAGASGPIRDEDPARAERTATLAAAAGSQLGLSTYRVHVDAEAAALTASHGSAGVMRGRAAYLDPARFDPETHAGRALLAHELTHVAQAALPTTSAPRAEAIALAEAEAVEAGRRFAAGLRLTPATRPLPADHVATGLTEDTQVKALFRDFFAISGLTEAGGGVWSGRGNIVVGGDTMKGLGELTLTAKLKEDTSGSEGWKRWEWAKAEKKIAPFGEEAGKILIESINTGGEAPRVDVTATFRDLELPGLAPIPELDLKAQDVADGKALSDLSVTARGKVALDTSGLIGGLIERGHVMDPSFHVATRRLNTTGEAVLKLPGIESNTAEFKVVDNVVSGTWDFASKRFGVPSEEPLVDGEVHGRVTIADNKLANATLQATTGLAIKGVPEDEDLVVWDLEVKGDGATDFRGRLTKPITFAWVAPQTPFEDLVLSELDGQVVRGSGEADVVKLHARVDLLHSKTRLGERVVEDNSFVFDYDTSASSKITLQALDPLVVHLLGTKGPHKLDVVTEGLKFAGPSLAEGALSFTSGKITGRLPIAGALDGDLLQTDSLRELNADLRLATDLMLPSEDAPLLVGRADSALQVRKGKLQEGKVQAQMLMALPGLDPVRLAAHLEVDDQARVSAGMNVTEPLVLVHDRLTLMQARIDRDVNGGLDGDLAFRVGPEEDGWEVEQKFDKSKGLTGPAKEEKRTPEQTGTDKPYDYSFKVGLSLSQGLYAEGRFGANVGPLRIEGMGRITQAMLIGKGADLKFGFVGDLTKPFGYKKQLLKVPKKKIPIIAWGGLAGLFAEAGADVGIQAQAGVISVDGGGVIQNLRPWGTFADKVAAKVNFQGAAQGSVVGGPTLGIGAWVSGGLLTMSGGLRMPLTATLAAHLSTSANITLTPDGVEGGARIETPLVFSMGGAAIPYFDFKALGGAIKSGAKEGKPLAELQLVAPTKVLDFGYDLATLGKPGEAEAAAEIAQPEELTIGEAPKDVEVPPVKAVPSQGTVAPLTAAPTEEAPSEFDTTKLWEGVKGSVGEEAWYKRVETLRVLLDKVGSIISIASDKLDTFVKWLSDNVKLDLASVGETFWSNIQSFTESFSGSSYLDVIKLVRTIWKGQEAEEHAGDESGGTVDINGPLETLEDKLVTLPGVGPAKAKSIKEQRVAVGRFKDKRELMDVPGIGQATYEKLEARVVAGEGEGDKPSTKIDLNAAAAEDMAGVEGIGAELATAIVEYRKTLTDGRFTAIEQLLSVPGVGPARLEALKELVQIGSEAGPDVSVSLGQLDLAMGSARLRGQVLSTQPLELWFPAAANTLRDDVVLYEFQGAGLTGDADGVEGELKASLFLKGLGNFEGMGLPVKGKTVTPEFDGAPFKKGEMLAELPVPERLSGKITNLPNALTELTILQKPTGAKLPSTIGGVQLETKKPISTVFDRPDGETWRLKGADGIVFGGEDSMFMAQLLEAEWAEQTGFSGSGQLAASLGSLGAAAGRIAIKNNKLESVKLGFESATLGFPKAAPLVMAQLMGGFELGPEHDTSAFVDVLATLPKIPSAPPIRASIRFDKDWNPSWKASIGAPVTIMSGLTLLSLELGEAKKAFSAAGMASIDLGGVSVLLAVSYDQGKGMAFSVVGDVGVPGLSLTSLSGGYGPGGISLAGGARFSAIPGFEPLDASFSYAGRRVVFNAKPVEAKDEEGSGARTKLKLSLTDFAYDMATRQFSGAGGLEGIVPIVGLVKGHFAVGDRGPSTTPTPKTPPESGGESGGESIGESGTPSPSEVEQGGFGERLRVTKGHLEVVNDRFRLPDAKPFIWGQFDASLDYEDGKVDGAIAAKGMRLDLPGMGSRALTLEAKAEKNVYSGKVGIGAEAKKRKASWITLKSFGGGYDGKRPEDPWSFTGGLGVSLGPTETALSLKYGAGVLSASGTVDFGKKAEDSRFWGTATATYDSSKEPTFGFSGSLTAKLADNLQGTATLAYDAKSGDPDHPGGVDLGLALSPVQIVEGRRYPKKIAGPWRTDFPLAAFPPVPLTLFGSLGGEVDLDYGSRAGISIDGAADIKGIHRDESALGGLGFDSAEVRPRVSGDLFAELSGGPSIGIGAALIFPRLASIQGTLGIPLKLTAEATPELVGSLRYRQGKLDTGAAISAPVTMQAAIVPTLSLDTMLLGYPKKWGAIELGKWPLMKPKKLFDFHYALGNMKAPEAEIPAPKAGELEDAPSAEETTNDAKAVDERKVEAKDAPPGGSLAAAQGGTFDLMGLKDKAVGKLGEVTEWLKAKWQVVAELGKAVWNKAKEFASTCGNWLKVGADYVVRLGSWARFWRGSADTALEEAQSSRYEIYNQPDLPEYEGFDEAKFLQDENVQSKIGEKARERYKDEMSAMKAWDEYSWGFIPVGSVVRFFGSGGATHEQRAREQRKIVEEAEDVRSRYSDPIARAKRAMEESPDQTPEMKVFYRFMVVAGRAPIPAALPVLMRGFDKVMKTPTVVGQALMEMGSSDIGWLFWSEAGAHDIAVAVDYLRTVEHRGATWFLRFLYKAPSKMRGAMEALLVPCVPGFKTEVLRYRAAEESAIIRTDRSGHVLSSTEEIRVAKFEQWALVDVEAALDELEAVPEPTSEQWALRTLLLQMRALVPGKEAMSVFLDLVPYAIAPERAGSWRSRAAAVRPLRAHIMGLGLESDFWILFESERSSALVAYLRDVEKCAAHHIRQALEGNVHKVDEDTSYWYSRRAEKAESRLDDGIPGVKREGRVTRGVAAMTVTRYDQVRDRFAELESPTEEQRNYKTFMEATVDLQVGAELVATLTQGANRVLGGEEGAWRKWAASRPLKAALSCCTANDAPVWKALAKGADKLVTYLAEYEGLGARDFRQVLTAGGSLKTAAAERVKQQVSGLDSEIAGWKLAAGKHSAEVIKSVDDVMDSLAKLGTLSEKQRIYKLWLQTELEKKYCKGAVEAMVDGAAKVIDPERAHLAGPFIASLYAKEDSGAWDFVRTDETGDLRLLAAYCKEVEKSGSRFESLMLEMIPKYSTWSGRQKQAATTVHTQTGLGSMRRYM